MKLAAFFLLISLPSLAADRVTFSDDRYSLEFPQGWTKVESPTAGAEFARESPDKSVVIAVNCDAIPENTEADLDAMAKSAADTFAKAIRFKGEGTVSDGRLDGFQTKFITLAPQNEEEGSIAMFLVMIDAKKHLVRITSSMTPELDPETKDACLAIVKSFRREADAKASD